MIARFNYTTYDVRRAQDAINPRTPHCNIILLKNRADFNDDRDANYRYAKVLGIHHVNVVRAGNVYQTRRLEFLFVRWYESVQSHAWETCTLGRVRFMPIADPNAFGFVDPGVVLRACHMIPVFSLGQRNPSEYRISALAGDKHDWRKYYVNRRAFLSFWFKCDNTTAIILALSTETLSCGFITGLEWDTCTLMRRGL
jgi:hypothetical protein